MCVVTKTTLDFNRIFVDADINRMLYLRYISAAEKRLHRQITAVSQVRFLPGEQSPVAQLVEHEKTLLLIFAEMLLQITKCN